MISDFTVPWIWENFCDYNARRLWCSFLWKFWQHKGRRCIAFNSILKINMQNWPNPDRDNHHIWEFKPKLYVNRRFKGNAQWSCLEYLTWLVRRCSIECDYGAVIIANWLIDSGIFSLLSLIRSGAFDLPLQYIAVYAIRYDCYAALSVPPIFLK